jgi:hypothetical protein
VAQSRRDRDSPGPAPSGPHAVHWHRVGDRRAVPPGATGIDHRSVTVTRPRHPGRDLSLNSQVQVRLSSLTGRLSTEDDSHGGTGIFQVKLLAQAAAAVTVQVTGRGTGRRAFQVTGTLRHRAVTVTVPTWQLSNHGTLADVPRH